MYEYDKERSKCTDPKNCNTGCSKASQSLSNYSLHHLLQISLGSTLFWTNLLLFHKTGLFTTKTKPSNTTLSSSFSFSSIPSLQVSQLVNDPPQDTQLLQLLLSQAQKPNFGWQPVKGAVAGGQLGCCIAGGQLGLGAAIIVTLA